MGALLGLINLGGRMKDDNIQLTDSMKSLILLQIGMKHGNAYVTAGHVKYYCSRYMSMILEWEEANELAEEYNTAA
jgi:hypothetical protein